MALIIKSSGEEIVTHPKANGKFSLEEIQAAVGGYIERVCLSEGKQMFLNEEGKLNNLPFNQKATVLTRGILAYDDFIVGDVIIVEKGEVD